MKRQVHIQAGYGAVEFFGTQARRIAALCEALLRWCLRASNAKTACSADAMLPSTYLGRQ